MLDAFCSNHSDEAQLKVAIRLVRLALPIWETHFVRNPADMTKVNALIGESNRIKGASDTIDIGFPERALEKIERSYNEAKQRSANGPVPHMKCDATLSPMLVTCMQPLTNKEWDNVLPQSVKLIFTAVFNILVWILKRRRTPDNETHIYVAINQAADALLRESMVPAPQIVSILEEYSKERRAETDDSDWENALPVGRSEPMDEEDIFRRIIGEKVNKDLCGRTLAKEVLRQMLDEGKSFWDEWEEYQSGTSITYSYNKEKQSFWRHEFDAIVGSFSNGIPMTENEMLDFVSQLALRDLRDPRQGGFEV